MRAKSGGKPRVIASDADVMAELASLRRKCPLMRKMYGVVGVPEIRRREAGLEGLARIIVAQQVSVASAAAIWGRTAATIVPFNASMLLSLPETAFRGAGLSGPKIRTLRAIATAVVEGLDLENLDGLSDEEVHSALTRISGIGPWTADIFLMFCLGRADAFAAGDLALQVAAQMVMERDERPSASELLEIAERWRPRRNVAALVLWAYYKAMRDAKSGIPV